METRAFPSLESIKMREMEYERRINAFAKAARDGDVETVKRMVEETPRIVKMIDTVRLCEMNLL